MQTSNYKINVSQVTTVLKNNIIYVEKFVLEFDCQQLKV